MWAFFYTNFWNFRVGLAFSPLGLAWLGLAQKGFYDIGSSKNQKFPVHRTSKNSHQLVPGRRSTNRRRNIRRRCRPVLYLLFQFKQRQPYREQFPFHTAMEKARSLLILYATETGNALDAAERLGREAERRSCPVRLFSLDGFHPVSFYAIALLSSSKLVLLLRINYFM